MHPSCVNDEMTLYAPKIRETFKGASIYDVRAEGGGGVGPKEDVLREVA